MDRIINPYNAVAFYTEVLEDHEEAPIYSAHRYLPPWQVEFNTTETSGGVTATIVDANLNTVQAIPGSAIANVATTDGKSYVDYKGTTDLAPVLDEGVYRIKLVTGDDTYYSHPICVSNAFQEMEFQLIPTCTSASGGGFTISVFNVGKDPDMESAFYADFGNGFQYIGTQTSGSFEDTDVIDSGAVTVPIRRNVYYPDGSEVYKEQVLSFNTSGCGGGSFGTAVFGGRNYDNYCYLEFYNSTDLDDLGILYQNNYKQKVYFHAAYSYPVPVDEETLLRNGENVAVLESVAMSEQINIDVYPVADYLIRVLQSVRHHDTINLVTCADEKRVQLYNFQFTTRTTENDNKSIGRISAEVKRVFVKGCQPDKTLA